MQTGDDEPAPTGLAGVWDETPEQIVALYDDWASGDYDDDVTNWGYVAPEHVATLVAAHLDGETGTVLDAGCGTGRVGSALVAAGVADVVGGDFTPKSVEAARARDVYASVDHLDLNAPLEYDDDRFAAAVSVGVFTYVADTAATLRELVRVVRPGGVVVLTQRTDLWDDRDMDAVLDQLATSGSCRVDVSAPAPYLPHHDEFGDDIGIRYVTLTVADAT